MKYTDSAAELLADQIRRNVRRYVRRYVRGVDHDQFSKLARHLWSIAHRDEPCVMGSDCDQRQMAVGKALAKLS